MWRRRSGQHVQAWLQRAELHGSAGVLGKLVPAEVAQLVSLQTPGMVALPRGLENAIDAAASETNRKLVKQKGQQLTQRLRQLSRSKHRGGVHPNLREQATAPAEPALPAARRSKRPTRRQLLHQVSRAAAIPVAEGAKPDVAAYWDEAHQESFAALEETGKARSARRELEALYDEASALAYGATRLPACYAALRRVLGEVKARMPSWRPDSMLDFGAGPGTATWAAQEVWREAPLQVTAVEPSPSMSWLGQRVWAAQQDAHARAMARLAQQQQREGKGEGEEQAGEERAGGGGIPQVQWQATWAGRELEPERLEWRREGGSGGSPGAARTTAAAAGRLPTGEGPGAGGWGAAAGGAAEAGAQPESELDSGDGGEESEVEEEEEQVPLPVPRVRWMSRLAPRSRAQGRQYGLVVAAYVLGEMRGEEERRKAVADLWQRTGGVLVILEPGTPAGFASVSAARAQILADSMAGSGSSAPSAASGGSGGLPSGAHVVAPCPHDGPCPLEGRRSWCHFVQRFERTGLQRQAKSVAGRGARTYQDERFSYVVLARGPRPRPADQVAVAGRPVPRAEDAEVYKHLPEDLQPRSIGLDPAGAAMLDSGSERAAGGPGGRGARQQGRAGSAAAGSLREEEEEDLGDLNEATKQLILDSILADLDEEEGEEAAALAAQLREQLFDPDAKATPSPAAAAEAAAGEQQLQAQQAEAAGSTGAEEASQLAAGAEPAVEWGVIEAGEDVDWAERDPEGLAAAVESSVAWSRVLRTPRKRSGHVVLDLCSAVEADGSPAPAGLLLRQVVSKGSASRQLGGPAPYRLARRVRWGDLWPLHYQRRLRAMEPPAAEAFQQE